MANLKVDNLRAKIAAIDNPVREGRYNTEDISPMERAYVQKHSPKVRTSRKDLASGSVVVVLEGAQMGRRAVFLQQLPEQMAAVFCISASGEPMLFKIDERYLFKLSATVSIPSVTLDAAALTESKLGESEKMDVEASDAEKAVSKKIVDAISQVKFMRSYLSEDFKVDHDVEFFAHEY
ncbi:large subunit ribosomal protein L6e [Pancytospora philotis]|nr:large subunit ribosomal protein L6e [Pancytospora philotis]